MKYLACLLFCWIAMLQAADAQDSKGLLNGFAIYPLRPTHDTADDFSDLSFLKDVLKDKRIVLLGEQSHGDGTTFEAKVRLVRFLHAALGFNMISFESGFYDNYKAGSAIKTSDPKNSPLLESIFPIWSETKEFLPLIQYIHSQAATAKPLLVSGFDCQESSFFEKEYLADLKEALGESMTLSEDEAANLDIVVSSGPELLVGSPKDSLTFFAAASKISRTLDKQIERRNTPHLAMLRQTLTSWLAAIRLQIDGINEKPVPVQNPRDLQMARNLIFLAQMHPDQKIICWGASYHFARSIAAVTDTRLTAQMLSKLDSLLRNDEPSTLDLEGAVPMGQLLADQFGKSLYSLAFSSYDGSFGMLGDAPVSLASLQPPAGSIEDELVKKGLSAAFVDFRGGDNKTLFYSSAFGNVPIYAQWTAMFDGQLFIKTSFPPSYPEMKPASVTGTPDAVGKKPAAYSRQDRHEQRVINANTKQGVDYASIALLNTSIGVLTNSEGVFIFNIPGAAPADRVIISSIGYETDTIPVKDFKVKNTIELKPKAYGIEAVTIRARTLSARDIVKRAEKRIRSNYYQGHVRQEFFFRTTSRKEDTVTFNEEAAVLVDNPAGFHAGSFADRHLTGAILQFRNTTRNASNREWSGVGGLWLMYSHNMILKKSNALHRIAFYTYTRSGVTEFEHRPVYKISFECKRPMSFTTGYGYPAPRSATGTMFIDKENFAVLKIEMLVRRKPVTQKKNPDAVTDPWIHYLVETYKEFNGKYFLNSSRQVHYSKLTDRKTNQAARFIHTMELFSTSINTAPAEPLESSLLHIKSGIPKEDNNFWNVHNYQVEETDRQLYKLFESE